MNSATIIPLVRVQVLSVVHMYLGQCRIFAVARAECYPFALVSSSSCLLLSFIIHPAWTSMCLIAALK